MRSQQPERAAKKRLLAELVILLGVIGMGTAILIKRRRRLQRRKLLQERRPAPTATPSGLDGLTEAEAESRRLEGEDNAVLFQPPRSWREIWRDNAYTIFNLSLVGLALVQFLLGLPLEGLLSLGMILLNIGLNAAQELLASRKLKEVELAMRPQATVIRDGKARSIDPSAIVRGDILVVGPGDEFLVDGALVSEGPIVVDESMLTGEDGRLVKHAGQPVYAGSFCVSGRAAYQAEKVGHERLIASLTAAPQAAKDTQTELERVVDRILRALLAVVAFFTIILLLRYFRLNAVVNVESFASAASVIFSIAPAGLYFMIFLTYASGRADLAKVGALVHRSRSIESLAQATVLCFAQAGVLTGKRVEIETIEPPGKQKRMAESRIRQILGDFARSTSVNNVAMRAVMAAFEGSPRVVQEEAPFLSVYGWAAMTFDDEDLRGVYVLGDPQVLKPHLVTSDAEATQEVERASPLTALRRRIPSVGRFFRGREEMAQERKPGDKGSRQPGTETMRPAQETQASGADTPGEELSSSENGATGRIAFRRWVERARRALRRNKPAEVEEETAQAEEIEEMVYLFAYHPDVAPLHSQTGVARLRDGLIPLCYLRYPEQVRPEAIDTIRAFSEIGAGIKVLTPGAPEQITSVLRQAGLAGDGDHPLRVISGPELAELAPEEWGQAACGHTIFGHMGPEQSQKIVQALRDQGQSVVVVGDGVADLRAMQQANLSVARRSSSQAALGVADVVLLEDSPQVLLEVLRRGQRIANGLLDVLRLYLTQAFYVTLLVLAVLANATGFPFEAKQGSLLGIVTLSIPSLGLTLWAVAGVLPKTSLDRLLIRFVMPASVATSIAGVVVYQVFLNRSGEIGYAQLALTHMLVISGLTLVIFLRPPWRGDWRPTGLALVLVTAFFLLAWVPQAKEWFLLEPLQQPVDYLVVSVTVLVWAFLLTFFRMAMPAGGKLWTLTRA